MASIADLKVARDFYSEEIIKASESVSFFMEENLPLGSDQVARLKNIRTEYVLIDEALKLAISDLGATLRTRSKMGDQKHE